MEADRDAWEPVGGVESNGGRGLLHNRRVDVGTAAGKTSRDWFRLSSAWSS